MLRCLVHRRPGTVWSDGQEGVGSLRMDGDEGAIAGGLAETIEALRAELTTAISRGDGQPLQFELEAVNVEFTLAITREGGDGGLRLGVVSFGASGKVASQRTHRLSLTLNPVTANGVNPVRVSASVDGEPG